MSKRVAILGCGPAGLLAAHAARQNGCDFRIFSKKRPSHLFGAQYLHAPITGVTTHPEVVRYALEGSPEEYRQKVYGDEWDGTISAEDLEADHHAWDIRAAYRELWDMYNSLIFDTDFYGGEQQVDNMIKGAGVDLVISSVPRTVWKRPGDKFEQAKIWAIGDAPDLGQFVPFSPTEDNMVLCNGMSDISWYRTSKVFGFSTVEYPWGKKPPIEGIQEVIKPLRCSAKGGADFMHVGRYGKWEKGVLTTDAFDDALKATA